MARLPTAQYQAPQLPQPAAPLPAPETPGLDSSLGFEPRDPFEIAIDPNLTPEQKEAELAHNSQVIAMTPDERVSARLEHGAAQAEQGRQDEMLALGANPGQGIGGENMGTSVLPEPSGPSNRQGIAGGAPVGVSEDEPLMSLPPEEPAGVDPAELDLGGPAQPQQPPSAHSGEDPTGLAVQALQMDAYRRGGGPVQRIPERDVEKGRVEKSTLIPDEQRDAVIGSANEQAALARQHREAEGDFQMNEAVRLSGRAAQREEDLGELRKVQAAATQKVEDQRAKVADIAKKAKSDPQAFWKRRDGFQTTASIIGFAMMAMSGKDYSKTIIDMINHDSELDLGDKERMLGEARSDLVDLKADMLSPEAFALREKAIKAEIAADDAEAQAMLHASSQSQNEGLMMAEKLRAQALEWEAEASKVETSKQIEHQQARTVGGGGGFDAAVREGMRAGLSRKDSVDNFFQANFGRKATPEEVDKYQARMVPGEGIAYDSGEAKTAREAQTGRDLVMGTLNRIRQVVKQHGEGNLPATEARAKLTGLRSELLGNLNKSAKFGAMDAGTQELLGSRVPDPSAPLDHWSAVADETEMATKREYEAKIAPRIMQRQGGQGSQFRSRD